MPNEFKVKNGLIVDAGGAQITGGITGSTDFNTIVNKPTLISSSAQFSGDNITGSNLRATSAIVSPNITWSNILGSNGGEIQITQGQFRYDRNITIVWGGTAGVNSIRDLGLRRNNTGSLEIYDGVNVDGAVINRRDLILRDITGSNAFFSGSSTITGSLGVSGSIIATNGITGSIAATNGVVSGSSQISIAGTSDYTSLFTGIASATSSLNTFSSSQNTKDSTLATLTGSIETKFAAFGASTSSLNAFTSSIDSRFSALQASTASLNVYTQSNDTLNTTQNARLTALEVATGSSFFVSQSVFLINNYTGSDAVSQSVTNARLLSLGIASSSLEFFTASQNTKNSTLALYTGSNDTKWANLAVYTASVDTKFLAVQSTTNSLNLYTASIRTALTASGVNLTANGALVVTLDVTASAFRGAIRATNGVISSSAQVSSVTATVTGTNSTELVRGNMADNDQFRILVGGTATNAGFAEIATADDGSEPIYVRQYTGTFTSLTRTATLLDGSGNTSFPGTVAVTGGLTTNFTSSPYHVTHRPTANVTFNIGQSTGNGATAGPFVNATVNGVSDTTSVPLFFNCSQFSVFVGYSEQMRLVSGGILYIGDGIVQYYGSWSDRKLKQNLKVIDNPLDKISKLTGYTFEWTKDSPYRNTPEIGERIKDAGLIAQDVEEVLPEVVTEKNKSKHLNYNGVTALHTEGIKELIKQNQELLERIKKLEEKLL